MSVFKKLSDVLEVAVRIERQGVELYNKLHNTVESSKAKDLFSFLAAEEEKHIGVFRQILEKVSDYAPRFDYPGEYGLFLDGVVSRLLDKVKKAGKSLSAENTNEALDVGIDLEKETILFYSELDLEGRFNPPERGILKKVINEERSHWQRLANLKNKIKF